MPVTQPSARGSLAKALLAAKPENREASLNEVDNLTYAATTRKSRDSRWKLGLQLSDAWDLDPLPTSQRDCGQVDTNPRSRFSAKPDKNTLQPHLARYHLKYYSECPNSSAPSNAATARPNSKTPSSSRTSLASTRTTTPNLSRDRILGLVLYLIGWTWSSYVAGGCYVGSRQRRSDSTRLGQRSHTLRSYRVHYTAMHEDRHRGPLRDEITPMLLPRDPETLPISRTTTTFGLDACLRVRR